MGLVLVVEDEVDLNNLIRDQLVAAGHSVEQAFDGGSAVAAIEKTVPDLVLLDWMLPDLDGLTVCRQIRQRHVMPVIMLTARTDEVDRVLGLEVGADDYVTKPFSPRELIARIRAVTRRGRVDPVGRKIQVKVGDLEIDRERFEVRMKGRIVSLTPREFDVLALLAASPGRVFGRDELLDAVWGRDGFVEPRTVDVHVARLRRKFAAARVPAPGVETVRGVGYRFHDTAS